MTNSKKAFNDLKASPGWRGKLSIAALVNMVPVLGWNNYGYFINWARNLPAQNLGAMGVPGAAVDASGDAPLPAYRVNSKNFTMGFYVFLIGLIIGVAVSILWALPVIGWLAGFAAIVIGGAFGNAMAIRCAILGNLGEAFCLRDVWEAFKEDPAGIFDATYLPLVIVSLVGIGVTIVYGILLAVIVGLGTASASGADPALLLSSSGPIGVVLTVVFAYVMSWLMTLAMATTFRAVAHWAL